MTIDGLDSFDDSLNYADLKLVVRSILVARSQDGATIQEIKQDYYKFLGEEFPYVESMTEFLLSIPGITCYIDHNLTRIFNIRTSEKSEHILAMVKNQKLSKTNQIMRNRINPATVMEPHKENLISTPENMCYFEDNYQFLKSQFNCWYNKSRTSLTSQTNSPSGKSSHDSCFSENEYDAHLYDYQLLGDDFFLSMAKMELKCRFNPGHRILQSGLCVSGQTIADATKRILTAPYINKKIIVNIGSVDIIHGRDLIDIQHDFLTLMNAFDSRGIQPIITTLAPLANLAHLPSMRFVLERFNDFIRTYSHQWKIIDLWHCMVNRNGNILFECYQDGARYVTGSNQPHVFWNKLGRQRILKEIKKNVMLY